MADLFVNTDRLAEAYYYLSKFSEYESSISEYQRNIQNAFLGSINNPELAALFTKAANCLSRSREKCQTVMNGLDSINSVCEWCNEESKAIASSISTPATSSTASQPAPANASGDSDTNGFWTGVGNAVGAAWTGISTAIDYGRGIKETLEEIPAYRVGKLGIEMSVKTLADLRITKHYKDGKVYLSGYKKSDHLTWRYDKDTFVKKQATKFSFMDKVDVIIDGVQNAYTTGTRIYNTWKDDSKSTEEKIIDTAAYGLCSAASLALDVAAVVAGNAVVAAIPIPVVNVVVGSAVEFVIETMAETVLSEPVVNQVNESIGNVVGAAKAGAAVVSKAVDNWKDSKTVANAAAVVGSAVAAGCQVVATTVWETTKTAATVVVETVKNVGKKVANFFKGW